MLGSWFSSNPLEDLQWKHRLILVAGPSNSVQNQIKQLQVFSSELEDRDLLVFNLNNSVQTSPYGDIYSEDVLSYFHLERERFVVMLIGKDGGTKVKSSTPLTPEKLFATIDGMPMRRSEMKRSN